MGGCSFIVLLPILVGYGIVIGLLAVLRLAFDVIVGTAALPLLVASLVAGIAVCVIVTRSLWLRLHDHAQLDYSRLLILPAVLAALALVLFCIAAVIGGAAFFEALPVVFETSA